ncbi:hypothetical protein LRP88_00685 [Fusarium phalaenopsidis]
MVVFQAFKNRRSLQQTHPASPKPKLAEWFGLITDGEVIAVKANIDLSASVRFSLDDTTFEATLQSAGFDSRQDQLDEMVTASDFFKVFPQLYRGELPANGKCIKDDDLTLGDHVNDSIVEVMSQMNQTASLAAELKQHSNILYTPLGPVQLNPLRGRLKKISNAEHDKKDSGQESDKNPNDVAFEIMRMTRHLRGTFLPNGTDLEAFYKKIGIDYTLLPAGNLAFIQHERHIKPSIILCPGSVCYQILKELIKWFDSYFKVAMCYGTKLHPIEPVLKYYDAGRQILRKTLVMPYTTAICRMARRKNANMLDYDVLDKIDKIDKEAEPADPEIFYNEDASDAIKAGGEFNGELGKISMERLLGPGLDSLGREEAASHSLPSGEQGSEHIGHNIFQDATSQVLNGSVLRVLSLLTTNLGFYLLTEPNRRNVKLLGDTEAVKILAEQKLAHFSQMDDT